MFSRSYRVLVGVSLARFSHADLSFGSSGHRAFRPLQPHTLVIMGSCQFKLVLTIFLQKHNCIVIYEHLMPYPSIETVLSFDLTVGGSLRNLGPSIPSTPMCRGCKHPRLSIFHQSWWTGPCLSMQNVVAVHVRHHRSSVLLSPEPRISPITPYQSSVVH
jgi:hypothetical protein